MAGKFFAQLRQQWIGGLALLLALTAGTAYAANTVFSTDIVDGEVKTPDIASNAVATGKIGNNQVFPADVRDDTLPDGGLAAADLAENAVGTSELQGARIFDSRDDAIADAPGGGAAEAVLLRPPGYEVIARCLEEPAGTVKASIVVKSVGPEARTSAVDSNAPNGVNNITNLAHDTEATLISVGPTTSKNWQTGQYAVTTFITAGAETIFGFNGNVAAATKFGFPDCRFQATALGGAAIPEG